MREWLGIYLRGFAMGAADAVPGVSGGTIALITGIYERFVDAIAGLSAGAPALLADLRGEHSPGRVAATRRTLVGMDVPFLLALGVGVVSGALSLANAVEYAMHDFPALTFAFFFGLILASPVVLRSEVALEPRAIAVGALGFVLAFLVSGLPQTDASYALPALFLVGSIAICAMVLPGVSGSLILLVIGAYDTMTGAIHDLTDATIGLASGGPSEGFVGPLSTIAVFALGALVGILTFARVVSWAIDAHRAPTMAFLVGVMLGALHKPAREIAANTEAWTPPTVGALLAAGLVGALLVLALEYVTDDLEY